MTKKVENWRPWKFKIINKFLVTFESFLVMYNRCEWACSLSYKLCKLPLILLDSIFNQQSHLPQLFIVLWEHYFMMIKDSCIENGLLLNRFNILYALSVFLRIPASQFHPIKWMSASKTSTCTTCSLLMVTNDPWNCKM